jgi:hypothetical protein
MGMKKIIFLLILLPTLAHANFMFQYGLNYSGEKDTTTNKDYDKNRTFHKVFLGASVNGKKTLFLGWNINSWSSGLKTNTFEDSYSMTEMGGRMVYFFTENYTTYLTVEWNPYAKGKREKASTPSDISGSSTSVGFGYRFKLGRNVGLGAGIHYHSLALKEEEINSTVDSISDKVTNIMPMLELTITTR